MVTECEIGQLQPPETLLSRLVPLLHHGLQTVTGLLHSHAELARSPTHKVILCSIFAFFYQSIKHQCIHFAKHTCTYIWRLHLSFGSISLKHVGHISPQIIKKKKKKKKKIFGGLWFYMYVCVYIYIYIYIYDKLSRGSLNFSLP